ncbi:MAG: hypothetical protein QOH17_247 [Pseudonocardiales bacterium]|nr:hypothetical protein [Pseudonocardiales bacterium]
MGELESVVALHPLREGLWVLLIKALYRAGRPSDALAAHRRVTRLLADELGVTPGPALAALAQRVLVHDPTLGAPPPGNLPAAHDALVGRGPELAAVRARLAEHRLVTVVGPAGVGKTRLAIEAARTWSAPDGVWLVRLEGVRTAAGLPVALADALPGREGVGGLRGAELLLVLDNCEHLVDAVAETVAHVLDATSGTRVLATSQRALGQDGEVLLALTPLAEADAIALFTARARERRATFSPGADSPAAQDIAHLCRALDGLPLAIELAAARTRVLAVPEILRRLDDRFALLADPTSRRPERRRTLAAALSWSYDLLFPDDQRGLWAIAQFPAGAPLPAVEHVLAALDVPAAATLDVVERLVDRSLVMVDDHATGTAVSCCHRKVVTSRPPPTWSAAASRSPRAARPGGRRAACCSARSPSSASATSRQAARPASRRSGSSNRWATPGGSSTQRRRWAGSPRPCGGPPTPPATTATPLRPPNAWASVEPPPCT